MEDFEFVRSEYEIGKARHDFNELHNIKFNITLVSNAGLLDILNFCNAELNHRINKQIKESK